MRHHDTVVETTNIIEGAACHPHPTDLFHNILVTHSYTKVAIKIMYLFIGWGCSQTFGYGL
jgi:hypothetical protein